MSLKIEKNNWNLLLIYSPQWWIDYFNKHFSDFWNEESIWVRRSVFNFKKEDLLNPNYDENSDEISFILWKLENGFYKIKSNILYTKYDILVFKDCEITEKYFILGRISILQEFEKLANQQIIIGWNIENSIPEDVFNNIIDSFPTSTEIFHYKNARVTNVLSEYLEWVTDSQSKYEKYLEKRNKFKTNISSLDWINEYEIEKYKFILEVLKEMLNNYEKYSEKEWEKKILDIILILFPKYIKSYNSVPLIDYYTDPVKPKKRQIDLILLDSNKNIDIIEIKKPSNNDLISQKPYSTRDNHTPMRNLSSAVMQLEKYIFHLSKRWKDWEKELSAKYKEEINIVNPKWILIIWRCNLLNPRQKFDFEIIKRQYSNIVDIITYDDLIRRLENLIDKFSKK